MTTTGTKRRRYLTIDEERAISKVAAEKLMAPDEATRKEASDMIDDAIRMFIREENFYDKIIPMQDLADEKLDKQLNSDKPVKYIPIEQRSPGATAMPFAGLPANLWMRARRVPCRFATIRSRRVQKEINELRTWDIDIRQMFSDNLALDLHDARDSTFIGAVNNLIGAVNSLRGYSQVKLHGGTSGGFEYNAHQESMKLLPSTPSRLQPNTLLMNTIMRADVAKVLFAEMKTNMQEDVLLKGFTSEELDGKRVITTIKTNLVPVDRVYQFCQADHTGKSYSLQKPTLHVKREENIISFHEYETIGGVIANLFSVAAYDYNT